MEIKPLQSRPIIYTLEQIRSFDALSGYVDALIGDANCLQTVLGATGTVTSNLVITPTDPASLTLNISNGFIAQFVAVDQSAYGSLPATTQPVLQLGANVVTTLAVSNSGLSAGQAQYVMVEAGFQQQDAIAANDPNGGILPYVNISNPANPFYGPGNSGVAQNTVRNAVCDVKLIYGTPATAGSEVPPTPDAGYVPVALVDLAHGQTSITGGEILDPNLVAGSDPAPVLAGLLNSHHNGNAGQAPKVKLSNGEEVQGELPMANLFASNTVGAVASARNVNGNPNGVLAGNANTNGAADVAYDQTNNIEYHCTTTGDAASAVWTALNAPIIFGAQSNWRPAPTSGTLNGNYYTTGPWTQTGPITANNCKLFFGQAATFNNTVTVNSEIAGGTAGIGNGTSLSNGGTGGGLGSGDAAGGSGAGGGGGHGGEGGGGGAGDSAGQFVEGGGASYPLNSLLAGSGGAGGGGFNPTNGVGGAGGGSLYVECPGPITLSSAAAITANGGNGGNVTGNNANPGGGGAGGGIQMTSLSPITISAGATVTANGGVGGNSSGTNTSGGPMGSGGGGGGGIISFAGNGGTNNGTLTANGGSGGTVTAANSATGAAGSNGIVGFSTSILGPRSAN